MKGKILLSNSGRFDVCDTDTGTVYPGCIARGSFRRDTGKLLAGDNVSFEESGDSYVITETMPRKNSLIRPPLANLDILFIVVAAAAPDPFPFYTDKLTVIAEHHHIRPVVIITKSELAPEMAMQLSRAYKQCGYDAFALSVHTNTGTEALRTFLETEARGQTAAFCGASGVGKSSLLNFLYPDLHCETGSLSARIERGKNTTRLTRLYPLSENTYLADTPGFSMLEIDRFGDFDEKTLPELFPEFRPHIGACRYTKCTHTKEEGCAILGAVKAGEIPSGRHDSYLELYSLLKNKKKY